jgi:hypothetical protein
MEITQVWHSLTTHQEQEDFGATTAAFLSASILYL